MYILRTQHALAANRDSIKMLEWAYALEKASNCIENSGLDSKSLLNSLIYMANLENVDYQFALGHYYNFGLYVGKNKEIALEWYKKAALNGHNEAKIILNEFKRELDGAKELKDELESQTRSVKKLREELQSASQTIESLENIRLAFEYVMEKRNEEIAQKSLIIWIFLPLAIIASFSTGFLFLRRKNYESNLRKTNEKYEGEKLQREEINEKYEHERHLLSEVRRTLEAERENHQNAIKKLSEEALEAGIQELVSFITASKSNISQIISLIPSFQVSHLIEEADRIRTTLEELEERLSTQQVIVDLANHSITQEGLADEIDSQKKRIDQMIEEENKIIENGEERILQEAEAIEAKIQKGLDEIQRSGAVFSDFRSILVYIKASDLRDETKKIHLELKQREKEYAQWKEILEAYQVHIINEGNRIDDIEVWINRLDTYIAQDLHKTSISLPGMIWKKTADIPPIYSDEHIIQRACVHIEERIQSLLNRQANHFLDELEKFLVKFKTFSDLYGETLRLSSQNGKNVLNLVEPFIGSEASGIDGTESQSDMYYITTEDRLKHTYCIGTTGCGKSKLLESLIIQDLFQGRGGCLLDPFGGLFRDVMAFVLFYEDMRNDALSLQKEVREFLEHHALNVNIYEFGDEEKIPVFVENAEQRGLLESIRNADIETSLPALNYKAIDISDKTNQETENPYRINPFQKEEEEHVEDIINILVKSIARHTDTSAEQTPRANNVMSALFAIAIVEQKTIREILSIIDDIAGALPSSNSRGNEKKNSGYMELKVLEKLNNTNDPTAKYAVRYIETQLLRFTKGDFARTIESTVNRIKFMTGRGIERFLNTPETTLHLRDEINSQGRCTLTEKSFQGMLEQGIPQEVLGRLNPLKNTFFNGTRELEKAIGDHAGKETLEKYNGALTQSAEYDGRRPFLFFNLPVNEQHSIDMLGTFLLTKMDNIIFQRNDAEKKLPFFTYIDEFHRFIDKDLAGNFSATRQYGMGYTVAHQNFAQLNENDKGHVIRDTIFANTNTKIIFKVEGVDAEFIMKSNLFHYDGKMEKVIWSDSKGESEAVGHNISKAISKTETESTTDSEAETHSEGKSKGRTFSRSTTHSQGVSKGFSKSLSAAKSVTKGKSKSVADSESKSVRQSKSISEAVSNNRSFSHGSTNVNASGNTFTNTSNFNGTTCNFHNTQTQNTSSQDSSEHSRSRTETATRDESFTQGRTTTHADHESQSDTVTGTEGQTDTVNENKARQKGVSDTDTEHVSDGTTKGREKLKGKTQGETTTQGDTETTTKTKTKIMHHSYYSLSEEKMFYEQDIKELRPQELYIITPALLDKRREFGFSSIKGKTSQAITTYPSFKEALVAYSGDNFYPKLVADQENERRYLHGILEAYQKNQTDSKDDLLHQMVGGADDSTKELISEFEEDF